jgi:hypothetical protein
MNEKKDLKAPIEHSGSVRIFSAVRDTAKNIL